MKKKLLLFVGVLGVLAGSLAYSQQGPGPASPASPEPPARLVLNRFFFAEPGDGVRIMFQNSDGGRVCSSFGEMIKMANGDSKRAEDIQLGDEFWGARQAWLKQQQQLQ